MDFDYFEKLQRDLIEQFKGKTNVEVFQRALARQLNEVKKFFDELLVLRWLNTAEGVQLDGIGNIVVLLRAEALSLSKLSSQYAPMDDETYRRYLTWKIHVNTSNCTHKDVYDAIKMFWKRSPLYYSEDPRYPATIIFTTPRLYPELYPEDNVEALLTAPLVKAAGVSIKIIAYIYNKHRDLNPLTHAELGKYTHWQLRHWNLFAPSPPPKPPEPPEPPEPPKPPIIGIPPPTLSLESGEFFLSITVDVIRPENFPDMTVFYFLNGNYSQPFVFDGTPFTVTHTTTVALFGMVGTQMTGLVSYEFVIEQPHFIDTMEFSDSVMTVNADSVTFSFRTVMKVAVSEEFTVGDDVGLTDAINLSFI